MRIHFQSKLLFSLVTLITTWYTGSMDIPTEFRGRIVEVHFLDHVFAGKEVVICRASGRLTEINEEYIVLTQWWTDGSPDDCEHTAIVRGAITSLRAFQADRTIFP